MNQKHNETIYHGQGKKEYPDYNSAKHLAILLRILSIIALILRMLKGNLFTHQTIYERMIFPRATLVNMITVTIGSLIGLWLRQIFPTEIQEIVFQAVGLGTILIGIKMALRLPEGYLLVFMFSLIIGSVAGQLLQVDAIMDDLTTSLKGLIQNTDASFSEGLITAFLLFCVGSMTIVGALEEGLQQKRELLYVKSILDGFSSIALASTYGIGVLFSIIPMLLFQGGITMMAFRIKMVFNQTVMDCLSAVGGILIIGISFLLLDIADIRLENLLPSLPMAVVFGYYYDLFKIKNKLESPLHT